MQGALGWGKRLVLTWPFWRHGLALEALRAWAGARGRADYWAWRVQSAYGDAGAEVPSEDLVAYLRWRRRVRRAAR